MTCSRRPVILGALCGCNRCGAGASLGRNALSFTVQGLQKRERPAVSRRAGLISAGATFRGRTILGLPPGCNIIEETAMHRIVALIIAATLTACAPSGKWTRPDGLSQAPAADEAACEYEAAKATATLPRGAMATVWREQELIGQCMRLRGWAFQR
jgi:hypothetical protein